MKPTRIELNARDLNWHNTRHENRQRQRAKGHHFPMQGDVPSQYIKTNDLEVNNSAYPSLDRQPSEAMDIIAAPQMPLFSSKPDLQKFWSGVMIGAGALPHMQQVITNKPVVVSGASNISSGLHSAKASLQEDLNNRDVVDEASYRDHVANHDLPDDCSKTSHQHNLDSPPTLGDAQDYYVAENDVNLEPSQDLRAMTEELNLHGHWPSHSSFVYSSRPNRARDQVSGQYRQDSRLRALDGSSDPFPKRENPQLEAAAIAERFGVSESSRAYEEAPASHSRRSSLVELGIEHISSLYISPFSPNEPMGYSTSTSTSLPQSLPLPIDRLRRLSSVHPRSPLHISQVPTSSSPERRPRPPHDANGLDFDNQMEMMTLQSRQRKRYKRRSQSYPYVLSEGEPTSNAPMNSSRSRNNTPSNIYHRPVAIISEMNHTYLSPSSVRGQYDDLNLSPRSGTSSATVSPIRRDLSLPTNPLTPRLDSSWDPPLPVPPHAFSAVRRAVSFTPALPSATPSPFSTPQNTPLAIGHGHLTLSVTPPSQRTPSYEVYNDRLPASSQPQTPRGLPTNGVPRSGLPSVYRGAFTAPAGLAGLARRARQRRSGVPLDESPTRQSSRGMGLRLDDQENERHGWETERQWRRRASLRGFGLDVVDHSSEDADA